MNAYLMMRLRQSYVYPEMHIQAMRFGISHCNRAQLPTSLWLAAVRDILDRPRKEIHSSMLAKIYTPIASQALGVSA